MEQPLSPDIAAADNVAPTTPNRAPTSRYFWRVLALLCLLALAARIAMLDEFIRKNPQAECPIVDAAVYWDMAGRMAEGHWIGETPFLSAPLYPYLLGVIRTLGGGLLAVYVFQLLMHLGTGVLIADAARRRFSPLAGLLAAGVFFLLSEPAVAVTRVLADTLQLLLAALLWRQWVLLTLSDRRWRDVLLTGVWIGLFALAYPAALLLVPAFGVWLAIYDRLRVAALLRAAVGVGVSVAVLTPATLHNFVYHHEFIPITAHSGVTLWQGNNPIATGNITALPDISLSREEMHADAAKIYRKAKDRDGSWREIDAYFREKATGWCREHPRDTLRLLGRKLYFFLNVRNYADIMSVAIEREAGLAERAILAPLQTPWILGGVLVGLIAALRRPLRHTPEWLLTLLPLLVVLLFFYSPRYRLPMLPTACGLAAYAAILVAGGRVQGSGGRVQGSGFRIQDSGFGGQDRNRSPSGSEGAFSSVSSPRNSRLPRMGKIAIILISLLVFLLPLPLELYHRRVGFDSPDRIRAHFTEELSRAQTVMGDRRYAEERFDAARARYRAAFDLWSGNAGACAGLASLELRDRRVAEALPYLREAVRLRPEYMPDRYRLYNAQCILQDYPSAAETLNDLILHAPQDVQARLTLAWLLATCPDERVRDGAAALVQFQAAERMETTDPVDRLDVAAAVRAAAGDFEQAVSLAEQALHAATRQGRQPLADALQARLSQYREQRPLVAPPRPLRLSSEPRKD